MRPPMPAVQLSRRAKIALGVLAALIVLVVLATSLVNVYVNFLWFGSIGFRGVYSHVLWTRVALFFLFGVVMALILGANLVVAYRLRPPFRPMSAEQQNLERYRIGLEPRKWLALAAVMVIALLGAGSSAQHNWKTWLLFFNSTNFGVKDPQFGLDVSFFAFDYPVYRVILRFLFAAVLFSLLLSAVVHYLYGALRLQTPGPKITIAARRHLTVLVFFFIVFKALAYWLDRYGLVFSNRGKVNGASYTDVNASLPAKTILFWIAVVIAIGVLASIWLSSPTLPAIGFAGLIVVSIVISGIYPALVQQISVKPNASQKEAKYISRNIAATRNAYGIATATSSDQSNSSSAATVTYQDYATGDPAPANQSQLTGSNYTSTIGNIRLLDPNVVSPTFTQLQQIRNVYGFQTKLDIDRYTIDGATKDYVVGVRELDAANLQGSQTNWISQHTTYTHGYGFVSAPAESTLDSQAEFNVSNIPPTGTIRITQPDVYFGELGTDYSIVGAQGTKREFDGDGSASVTYSGDGGVRLGNIVTRAAFAVKYGEVNFLLNDAVSAPGARVIFDRNPRERVLKVAPWLKVDGDPYPSVVNGKIVWILDGYTTMNNYPYSEKEQLGTVTADALTDAGRTARQADSTFNYIRNSVKATVDAYTGKVTLYQWDTQDPLLKAWMKVFPGTVRPKSDLTNNAELLAHIRYPSDLFEVQRDLLARYHVDDPVSFYTSSDQWTVPSDPYASGGDQPPYYILAGQPDGQNNAEYQLTSPMRVNSKENLAAYISVNSEGNSADYGKFTVLRLPSGSQTFGPRQVANQFKSESKISSEITLFDQGGSKVVYGNLLTLPVGNTFLYVEPLYVQGAEGANQPILRRVIVYYAGQENRVGYGSDLQSALANLDPSQSVGQGIDDTTNPNGTQTSSPSQTPTSSPPSSSPTSPSGTPSTPGGSAQPSTVPQVLAALRTAGQALDAAYASGDPVAIANAQVRYKRLVDLASRLLASSSSGASPTR